MHLNIFPCFLQAGLPVLTIPFVTTSAMYLAVSSGLGKERLFKAPDGRPPEYQRWRHQTRKRHLPNDLDEFDS